MPVVQQILLTQQDPSTEDNVQSKKDGKTYYRSLTSSLYSVTIEPNPIRGYDWRGLMKRGEVVEETFVRKMDANGNEVVEPREEQRSDVNVALDSKTKSSMHLDGLSVVQAHEKKKNRDDTSVASRSIGVQTDSREMEGNKILIPKASRDVNQRAVEIEPNSVLDPDGGKEKDLQPSTTEEDTADLQKLTPPNSTGTTSVYANRRRDRKVFLQKTKSHKANKAELSPGVGTLSGIKVGAQSNSIQPSPIE